MKAVILAGGLGTRISEETQIKPKPMIEIGGKPILWHIMKHYSKHGVNDFVICAGYKGYVIKEYFFNYHLHQADLEINLGDNAFSFHDYKSEQWRVTIVDTGEFTQTGGRLKRIGKYLSKNEPFCMTYGDGVSDLDITATIKRFKTLNSRAMLTSYSPGSRFGVLETEGELVKSFIEKPDSKEASINAGFFVLKPDVLNLIDGDDTVWEQEPLSQLAANGELNFFHHTGFWHPMDTLRDKNYLDKIWHDGGAPWKS